MIPASGRAPDRTLIRTAFVSTYPPWRCGIATFTHDLAAVAGWGEIVALSPPDHQLLYPSEVHHRIRRDEAGDYARTARALARCGIDVVSIQHEYGIWGGADGEHVLEFLHALEIPAVATLHTVLRHPTPRQRRILVELVALRLATSVVLSAHQARLDPDDPYLTVSEAPAWDLLGRLILTEPAT